MARVVYYVAASLDGFIADASGGVGWLPDGGSDDYGYAEFYAGVDALVMGRRTYDQVIGFGEWPYPGKATYVFTHSPPPEGPDGVRFFLGTTQEFIRDVAAQYAGMVWLVGGGDLADQFRQAGIIDEYQVFVIPIVLGQGVPLFGGPGSPTLLELESAQTYADGVVQLRYRPRDTR